MVVLISNSMIFDTAGLDRISPHNPFVVEVPPSDNPGLKLHAYRALQLCHTLTFYIAIQPLERATFFVEFLLPFQKCRVRNYALFNCILGITINIYVLHYYTIYL